MYQPTPDNQIEDLGGIYMRCFGSMEGTFVDVGAYDGRACSNTRCLADAGWRGVMFEPLGFACKRSRKLHRDNPRITVVQCCIGDYVGDIEVFAAGMLSTTSRWMVEIFNTLPWSRDHHKDGNSFVSPILTLDFALSMFGMKPGIDVVSIDTEGTEADVLRGFELSHWKPRMVIVEANELHEDQRLRGRAPPINAIFDECGGYSKIYVDEGNSIFWLEEEKCE